MMTSASSSSDRVEAARKALARYDEHNEPRSMNDARMQAYGLASALRALIEPPATLETPEEIAERILMVYSNILTPVQLMTTAVRSGIDAAWGSWEPDAYSNECGEEK